MDNQTLAQQIIALLGGKDNILQSWHCITRLRFNVKEDKQVKINEINQLAGVMGSQFSGGQFQVIIGAKVEEVYSEVEKQLKQAGYSAQGNDQKKMGPVDTIFDAISGIFTPVLPAIVGSGLIKGLMALVVSIGLLSPESTSYSVLNIFSDAVFYFLPFFIAVTAARKFKTKESLAVALAAILLYPTIVNGAAEGSGPLSLFGLPIPLNNYTSSVLPIILGVLLLSFVNKRIDKIIPKSVNIIFSPLLTLLITGPILLAIIAPLGNFVGKYLELIFTTMFEVAGPIAGILMGGLMPLIVITGMHYAFFPGAFASLQKLGYEVMLLPMNLVANVAQAGAVLGVMLKAKKAETRSLAFSTFIPAIFGITEPAIYGVTLRLKKPFYASIAGGAVGGGIYGLFAVKAGAFSIPGITSLPTYIMGNSNNFLYAMLGYIASFAVSLIVTLVLGFEEEKENEENDGQQQPSPSQDSDKGEDMIAAEQPAEVYAPVAGEVKTLTAVSDTTFSSGMMGSGVAILPSDGVVYAPFSGVVSMLTPTNHAVGLLSSEGIELLIHVGIDTVNLKGVGFEVLVSEKELVRKGEPILRFNLDEIIKKGFDPTTMVIVTNSSEFLDVIVTGEAHVSNASRLLMCIK